MNEIIALSAANIGGEQIQTVNARDLHAFLGVKGKLFKNPCSQAELNKIVPFGFSLQRQKNGVFFAIKIV